MNPCRLGVNAFQTSVQAAAHSLTRRCTSSLPAALLSNRCFSISPTTQHQPQLPRGGHARNTVAGPTLLSGPRPVLPRCLGIRTIIASSAVITHYVDLPPNYTDEKGLPFAKHDLKPAEVVAHFGPRISTTAANKLLRILHGRRVAGTLEDPSLRINTMAFTNEDQRIALEYLRSNVPVDEIANAGLRAEDELAALEGGGPAKSQQTEIPPEYQNRVKLYKDADVSPKKDGVYGPSALDAIRARNKAKWEAELKRREEEKKRREEEERHGKAGPLQVAGKSQTRQLSAKMQEYIVQGQSDLKEPPKMKKWQRVLPSAAFVVTLSGLCLALAEFYTPPKRADRLLPDIPPAAATVGTLILANLLGWGLWKIPPMWRFLNHYFILVAATPRVPTMVSAAFSHQKFFHLVQNMALLWFFGVRFHDDVGRGTFLATYFASGALGALGTLTWAVMRNRMEVASLGASGAVYGISAAYFWLHRFESFRIFGLPPPPNEGFQGLTLLSLAVGLNIGAMFTASRFTVDITSHLVGMGVGILAGHLVEERKKATTGRQKSWLYI
ncbi:rhomboid-domain-containing protein [Parathielavia appendiculata]|uniref:Rhomboid-domain-containing protein n=1 Tax=Parathielavia appendiculata TaxID=2587402 RepID=A0AAN6Z7Q6_9PEZI|nr:rhomboid-domain-containing protein [Parathielavia appendiculata]